MGVPVASELQCFGSSGPVLSSTHFPRVPLLILDHAHWDLSLHLLESINIENQSDIKLNAFLNFIL